MLRLESIRAEGQQDVRRSLDPSQRHDDIARRGRYWQRIVMFFSRPSAGA